MVVSLIVYSIAATLEKRLDVIKDIGGVIGTSVSAFFLIAIALMNIVIFRGVWQTFQEVRKGGCYSDQGPEMLLGGGVMARLFRPFFRMLSRPWHMYPIGFLFGLGSHGYRSGPSGNLGGSGGERVVRERDGGVSATLHRGYDASRHDGWNSDGRGLWVGLHQANPQTVLQSDHHFCVGHRGFDRGRD